MIIENAVLWMVDEDGEKLFYMTPDEATDLCFSLQFALNEWDEEYSDDKFSSAPSRMEKYEQEAYTSQEEA